MDEIVHLVGDIGHDTREMSSNSELKGFEEGEGGSGRNGDSSSLEMSFDDEETGAGTSSQVFEKSGKRGSGKEGNSSEGVRGSSGIFRKDHSF